MTGFQCSLDTRTRAHCTHIHVFAELGLMFLGNDVNYIELYRRSGVLFFFLFLIMDNAALLSLGVQDYIKVVSAHIMTPASLEFSLQVILKIATRVQ